MHRRIVTCVALLIAGATVLISRDERLEASQSPAPDNLVVPAGIARSPLGSLGHVEVLGRGPVPMILIPGAPFGWTLWKEFAARNAERYTMYAITPAGFDGTAPPAFGPDSSIAGRSWTTGLLAGLHRLITDQRLDRPVVVANHLMAGYYAVRLALDRGCAIGGVVSIASAPIGFAPRTPPARGPATPAERQTVLNDEWIPFYRAVDSARWSNGMWAAGALSSDSAIGSYWQREQLRVPVYVQARYFLEFLSDDVSQGIGDLRVPILALQPRTTARIRFASDSARAAFISSYNATSESAALDSASRRNNLWVRSIQTHTDLVSVRFLESRTQLLMIDEPVLIDSLIAEFVRSPRPCRVR